MCGRAAYSARALSAAAAALDRWGESDVEAGDGPPQKDAPSDAMVPSEIEDKPNVGPGHVFHVFRRSRTRRSDANGNINGNDIECVPMTWGLLPTHGTQSHPHLLPGDPAHSVSPHYAMFNARSETLYEKRSFSGLVRGGQTCVVALDGYYEWTESQRLGDKKKQPYFVSYKKEKNQGRPLLMAALWSCVRTGRRGKKGEDEETIATFTILTTDAHPKHAYLHPRQPVMLWDIDIALEWLMRPSPKTVERLRTVPIMGESAGVSSCGGIGGEGERKLQPIWETELDVHPVSKRVNDGNYQGGDCMEKVKLEKTRSVRDFFAPGMKRTKKPKLETNIDENAVAPQPAPEMEIASSPRQCTPVKREERKGNSQRVLHLNGGDEPSWICSRCTYVHVGAARIEYLLCELCGTERTHG